MPLPASLFLQRGRSDSMMNMLDSEDATSPVSATPLHAPMPPSDLGLLQAPDTHIEVDKNGAPLSTPPITMTAFDSQYGPYGLLASAMSCSDEEPQTRLHHNASTFSTANANTNNASSRYPFNPRANLLRRTSSSSTLDSSEDEEEVAWSQHDIERLTAVGIVATKTDVLIGY